MRSRREFLCTTAAAAAGGLAAASPPASPVALGKADHCIFLWMGGGMSHLDTFDPKRRGDPKAKKPGSDCDSIPTAVAGVRVGEGLQRTANLLDRMTVVRTTSHGTIDEHATATYFVHTGRMPSDTIRYPSIGSLVVHNRPAAADAPGYVVLGIPNVSRDPGFLGPRAGYLHVTETGRGPEGFIRPAAVSDARAARREEALRAITPSPASAGQREAQEAFRKLAGPRFLSTFDLSREPADLRATYGGEFGQRCLTARRLVQAGARFVEVSFQLQFVNGAGWDVHDGAQKHQPALIRELDAGFATLLADLERLNLLDRTLVVIGTEFGRPAEFDGGGGRGHQSRAYSMVLAGGGLRHKGALGETNELGKAAGGAATSIPDFHATMLAALGVDPRKELYDGARPVPVTDGGAPLAPLFDRPRG